MNPLLPYLSNKTAARLLILHVILLIGFSIVKELIFFNDNTLFLFIFYSSLNFVYLYIWATFWKIIVHQLGAEEMNPYFLMIFIVIVLGGIEVLLNSYDIPNWAEFGFSFISSIPYMIFSIKLLTIPLDLYKNKQSFAYTYILLIIITLALETINQFDIGSELGEDFIIMIFFGLTGIIFVGLFIANYIIYIQIFNRAEKARLTHDQNPIEKLINEIGDLEKPHDTTRP